MANILFLVHRIPYPPDKGDKVRSYRLFKHLAAHHAVHLGTFIDDPADRVHRDAVSALCADACFVDLEPKLTRVASLRGLLAGEPLTLPYYRHATLRRWIGALRERVRLDAVVIFSSCMVQYVDWNDAPPVLLDFVDVDSAKWTDYARNHPWPLSWLYAREGQKLLAFERASATKAAHGFFATEKEAALFLSVAPEQQGKVSAMNNGVDANFFSPDATRPTPFAAGELALVFTGAMDYWPNIDAVTWFVQEALPVLRRSHPSVRLYVVGRSPAPAVQRLAGGGVNVTGTVPDVRPYLQYAAVVVAPLRIARGVQNKVLEAMAMGRPVVASSSCVGALNVVDGEEVLSASSAQDFVGAVQRVLDAPELGRSVGEAGRRRVLLSYTWEAHLRLLDRQLDRLGLRGGAASAPAVAVAPAGAVT